MQQYYFDHKLRSHYNRPSNISTQSHETHYLQNQPWRELNGKSNIKKML